MPLTRKVKSAVSLRYTLLLTSGYGGRWGKKEESVVISQLGNENRIF
jgi:hypothetical protein